MSMHNTTLALGNFCILFTWRKVTSARRVTRCCTTGNPRDSKMRVLAQATTLWPLLSCANAVDEN